MRSRVNATAAFAMNVSLLLTMLVGLLRLREARRSHGLWSFLWWQVSALNLDTRSDWSLAMSARLM